MATRVPSGENSTEHVSDSSSYSLTSGALVPLSHTRPPAVTRLPSCENAGAYDVSPPDPLSLKRSAPVLASHSRTSGPLPVEARRLPSGERATADTTSFSASVALMVTRGAPVAVSQRRTFSFPDTKATRRASRENATKPTSSAGPWKARRRAPDAASHRRTVRSSDPEARRLPSTENAAAVTAEVCPSRRSCSCQVSAS